MTHTKVLSLIVVLVMQSETHCALFCLSLDMYVVLVTDLMYYVVFRFGISSSWAAEKF